MAIKINTLILVYHRQNTQTHTHIRDVTSFHFSVSFYFFCCCFELSEIRAILIWKWMIFQRMQKNCASNEKKSREGERNGANRIMKFDDMWRNGIMERLEKKQIRWRIEKHRDENVNKRVIKWYFMPYAHVQMNRINFEPNELLIHLKGDVNIIILPVDGNWYSCHLQISAYEQYFVRVLIFRLKCGQRHSFFFLS